MKTADLLTRTSIRAVWLALGGPEPNQRGRARAWYRDGSNPESVSLDERGSRWFDHGSNVGGGILELVATVRGWNRQDARAWLLARFGETGTVPSPRRQDPDCDDQRIEFALNIWSKAGLVPGTLAAVYLSSRGLDLSGQLDLSHALRFHPRCPFGTEHLPCLVGLLRDTRTDEPTGIHRTAIDHHGRKLGRKMLGRARTAAVKISEDTDVLAGLGVCEGIETALSIVQRGWRPVWALLSAGGIERFPVLDGVEALTIWADHDEPGERAASSCAGRWAAAGVEVTVRRPAAAGTDYNDAIRGAA